MAFEVRSVRDLDEFTTAVFAIWQYFGSLPSEERMQRFVDQVTLERMHGAWSDGSLVGGAGAFTFNLTVPGGDLATAGISVVGVYPTHRRRGVLRSLMRAQLDDVHARGEPLAALWASEETWPGMFSRNRLWWEHREIFDPEERRDGAGPKRWVLYERDGSTEGYAAYRHKPGFEQGSTAAELRIVEALGVTPEATRDLWGYLLAIDWIATVKAFLLPPDHPLFLLLANPRRMLYRMGDGLWVRVVDVGPALSGRRYADEGAIVFELSDEFCPWNAGRWKLEGGSAARSGDEPDLRLTVQSLGSAYLGGVSFASLARAGRVEELKGGGLARADRLFRWDRHPWCPEIF